MATLVDTSTLVRWIDTNDPRHNLAAALMIKLQRQGERLVVAPQCLYEFWTVVTRPADVNGLGMLPTEAGAAVNRIRARFELCSEPQTLLDDWFALVTQQGISGKPAHDARLAALMLSLGIGNILTFNPAHFARFPGISAIDANNL